MACHDRDDRLPLGKFESCEGDLVGIHIEVQGYGEDSHEYEDGKRDNQHALCGGHAVHGPLVAT